MSAMRVLGAASLLKSNTPRVFGRGSTHLYSKGNSIGGRYSSTTALGRTRLQAGALLRSGVGEPDLSEGITGKNFGFAGVRESERKGIMTVANGNGTMMKNAERHRVAVIGSGNWGTTISKVVAESTAEHPELFEREVKMWVHEERHKLPSSHPQKHLSEMTLTSYINTIHENPKYLPNISLPHNIHASSDLIEVVRDATIIIFNVPHQFVRSICTQLKGHVLAHARGISCIKGVSVEASHIELYTDTISRTLGIYCGALSGANIATEIAQEKFAETTVADAYPTTNNPYTLPPPSLPAVSHHLLKTLFHRPYFHVRVISDVPGVSLGGALKNIVALATGFVDGLGWGDNAKAAIMRVGLLEMRRFGQRYFSSCMAATFTEESCGVADLITSCNGGRNHRCAKRSVERGVSVDEVERTELNGQLAQGIGTAREVFAFLRERGDEGEFPLFVAVYRILEGEARPEELPQMIESEVDS